MARSKDPTGRAIKSERQYRSEAERLSERASRLYPDLPPNEALIEEAARSPTIKATTMRRYKPSYYRALEAAGTKDLSSDFSRLSFGLTKRVGTPDPEQTSTLKVTDMTRDEAAKTFRHLKAHVLKGGGKTAMAAGLYVVVDPRIGCRPIELLGAELDGKILVLKNAKRRDGKSTRRLNLGAFSSNFIEAVKWLCILATDGTQMATGNDEEERFEHWRDAVAEALARASITATGRRLSLSSFRHVALATWKANGFSENEIAAMAGHLRLKSAGHYAPGRHGWRHEQAIATPDISPQIHQALPVQPKPDTRQVKPKTTGPQADAAPTDSGPETAKTEYEFIFEDLPMPEPKPQSKSNDFDARPHFKKIADEAAEAADRFQKSYEKRQASSDGQSPGKRRK